MPCSGQSLAGPPGSFSRVNCHRSVPYSLRSTIELLDRPFTQGEHGSVVRANQNNFIVHDRTAVSQRTQLCFPDHILVRLIILPQFETERHTGCGVTALRNPDPPSIDQLLLVMGDFIRLSSCPGKWGIRARSSGSESSVQRQPYGGRNGRSEQSRRPRIAFW